MVMKWKSNAKTWLHLVALATGIVHFVNSNQLECKGKIMINTCCVTDLANYHAVTVLVEEPWPMQYLAVPQDSIVEMNCSANLGDSSFWAVDLGNDSAAVQYQFGVREDFLNSHGFYELSQIEIPGMTILRLLINDTSAANNQTTILCRINAQKVLSTTLIILSKLHCGTYTIFHMHFLVVRPISIRDEHTGYRIKQCQHNMESSYS